MTTTEEGHIHAEFSVNSAASAELWHDVRTSTFVACLLTVFPPVLGAVHYCLHAEPHVDVAAVRVAVALQTVGAVLAALAGLHLVLLGDLGVVLPGVAEVLEAGVVRALARAVTVVYARLEGHLGLGLGRLLHLAEARDIGGGEGEETGQHC